MIRLIDANALIDAMYNARVASAYEAQDIINSAPTIEPKRGEWIDKGADLDGTLYYQCSNCHANVIEEQYPNCPYCLARMKGADDE